MDTSTPLVQSVITKVGVKPAESPVHNVARFVIVIGILFIIVWSIYYKEQEEINIDRIRELIKPGTIHYQAIQEMDDEAKVCYIRSLKEMTDNNHTSIGQKYFRALKVSLIAGVISEYIENGNTSKPLGIIFKTIMYTMVSTSITL